ncbi:MAG: NAD(P)-dependent oxidoreductase [Bdellovibrionota bacterium]
MAVAYIVDGVPYPEVCCHMINGPRRALVIVVCVRGCLTDIHQKTWGLVGFGNIGQRVEQLARSFGCKTQYTSTSGKNTQDCQQVDLNIICQSDHLNTLPFKARQTKNMIDQAFIHSAGYNIDQCCQRGSDG